MAVNHSRIPTKTRKNFSYFTARNISRNSELVNYYARFFEQTRKQMMLTACNVVPHFERCAIPFEGYVFYNIYHCTQYSVNSNPCYFEQRSLCSLREYVPKRHQGQFTFKHEKLKFLYRQRLNCLLNAFYTLRPRIRTTTYPV